MLQVVRFVRTMRLYAKLSGGTTVPGIHLFGGSGVSKEGQAEPQYDVAISFLKQQLGLAERIRDALGERRKTFVFSQEQPEVVGSYTNGVEAFSSVFRDDCRVCVILHSDGWGKRGYTHVEQVMMHERVPTEGYDFLIVVRLDKAEPPKWIPTAQIYYDYTKYGFDGLIETIEKRVAMLGGRPNADPVLARAARIEQEHDFAERKTAFATSLAGFKATEAEVTRLFQFLERRIPELGQACPSTGLTFEKNDTQRSAAAISPEASCVIYWQRVYANSLNEAALLIVEWGGWFKYSGTFGGPPKLGSFSVTPTIDYANQVVWESRNGQVETSEKLVDYFLERLLKNQGAEPPPSKLPFPPRSRQSGWVNAWKYR